MSAPGDLDFVGLRYSNLVYEFLSLVAVLSVAAPCSTNDSDFPDCYRPCFARVPRDISSLFGLRFIWSYLANAK